MEHVPTQVIAVLAKLMGYLPRKRLAEFNVDDAPLEAKIPVGSDAILKNAQRTGALLRLKLEVASVSNPALTSENRETVLEVETAMESLKV